MDLGQLPGTRINHLVLWTRREKRQPGAECHLEIPLYCWDPGYCYWHSLFQWRMKYFFTVGVSADFTFLPFFFSLFHWWLLWTQNRFLFLATAFYYEITVRASWGSRLPAERTPLSADHPCKWVTRGARGMHKTLKRHFTSAHGQPLWFVGLFFSKLKTSLHTHWLLLITHIMVIYLLLINVSPYLFWRQGSHVSQAGLAM